MKFDFLVILIALRLLLIFSQVNCFAKSSQDLTNAWIGLGWKNVAMLADDQCQWKISEARTILTEASGSGISVSFLRAGQITRELASQLDGITILESIDLVETLVVNETVKADKIILWYDQIRVFDSTKCLATSTSFFLLQEGVLFRVQAFQSPCQMFLNKWNLMPYPRLYKETFDLMGSNIRSVSLEWAPWLIIGKCLDGLYRDCETSGVFSELMNSMATLYNFTWTQDKEPSGSWGKLPINGSRFYDSNPSGVVPQMVMKKYDLSVSGWATLSERVHLVDTTLSISDGGVYGLLYLMRTQVDFGLFVRPFSKCAWAITLSIVVVYFGMSMSSLRGCTYFPTKTESSKISHIVFWLFFVLVHSFYSGAMTMFFTSATSMPFQTVEEGLLAQSSWKMVYHGGTHQ